MKNLKSSNIKFTLKGKALIIATVLAMGLTGCSKDKVPGETLSLEKVMEKTANDTYIDDVLSYEDEKTDSNKLEELENIEERIIKYHWLENLEFSDSGYRKYTEGALKSLENYTLEDVREMLALLKEGSLNENEKVEMMQCLYWMRENDKVMLSTKDLSTVENALLLAVKATTCKAKNISPEYYNNITICPKPNSEGDCTKVVVEDSKNTKQATYMLSQGSFYECLTNHIYTIQNIQAADDDTYTFADKLKALKTSLNYFKESCFVDTKVEEKSFFNFFGEDELKSEQIPQEAAKKIRIK